MLKQITPIEAPRFDKKKISWIVLGLYTACNCFTCVNKIKHEFERFHINILCGDPCHHKPKNEQHIIQHQEENILEDQHTPEQYSQ